MFLMLTACTGKDKGSALIKKVDSEPVIITNRQENHEIAKKMKETALSMPEIYDVAIIKGKKQTVLAYKVKHLQRFRLNKIQKTLNEKLKDQFPKEKVTVSYDYKIFLETIRLQEKIKSGDVQEEKAEKELRKIIKLNNEKT